MKNGLSGFQNRHTSDTTSDNFLTVSWSRAQNTWFWPNFGLATLWKVLEDFETSNGDVQYGFEKFKYIPYFTILKPIDSP